MALNNYSNLKQAVMKWTHRDDIDEVIDDIIDLTEAEIFTSGVVHPMTGKVALLRVRDMEEVDTGSTTIGSREYELPDDFLEMRSIKVNGLKIELKTPENLSNVTTAGRPCAYTVTNGLLFDRPSDAVYEVELDYYSKGTPLDSIDTENTILEKYPNVYLWGCINQANIYAGEEEKAVMYQAKCFDAIRTANKTSNRGRYGIAPAAKLVRSIA